MTISQEQQTPKKHNLNSTFFKVVGNSFGCSFQWVVVGVVVVVVVYPQQPSM
jgi:hypothetical protein